MSAIAIIGKAAHGTTAFAGVACAQLTRLSPTTRSFRRKDRPVGTWRTFTQKHRQADDGYQAERGATLSSGA